MNDIVADRRPIRRSPIIGLIAALAIGLLLATGGFTSVSRRKVPTTVVRSLKINIEPFSQNDRLVLA